MSTPMVGVTGRRSSGVLARGRDPRHTGVEFDSYFSHFATQLAGSGAIPVYLPFEAGRMVVNRLDAVIITGGQDIHPLTWGGHHYVDDERDGDPRLSFAAYDAERDEHETALIRAALRARIPVLGVCRGHQLLNVALGGTLVTDIPRGTIEHDSNASAPDDGDDAHVVHFDAGTVAHGLYGAAKPRNSWHHQAVDTLGRGLVVSGRTDDDVIESVELPGRDVLGVQWHPEWQIDPDPVFDWLVRVAQDRRVADRCDQGLSVWQ